MTDQPVPEVTAQITIRVGATGPAEPEDPEEVAPDVRRDS